MAYEVDYLPVGGGEKSGDAIAIRYGNLSGSRNEQTVIVIDGGTLDSGQRLVEHIEEHYDTDVVDLLVSTHPDKDHISGARVVIEDLHVKRLWMHQPWNHAGQIRDAFADGRITNDSLSKRLQDEMAMAYELEEMALLRDIPIFEPFSDSNIHRQFAGLWVLGPSTDFYRRLLPQFDKTPLAKSASETFFGRMAEAIKSVAETRNIETLAEPTETRAENDSSAILLLHVDGRRLLFTGDAGVPALEEAAHMAEYNGVNLQSCVFQQVPHHGSRRNVGPSILNRIVGPIGGTSNPKSVIVSASTGGAPKHPARKVTNAYLRRGANVVATQGQIIRHHSPDCPLRPGWGPVAPVPFYPEVDE